jgi:RimJ/RimL family protein N-acetyltransferase
MSIYIRNLKINDLEQYNKIHNQFINNKNTFENTETHMLHFIREIHVIRFGICDCKTHNLIGYCTIGNINYIEKYCSIHIAIEPTHQRKGFGTETLNMLHNLIFNIYKLNYIFLTVDKNNKIAKQLYSKLGYEIIGFNPTENKKKHSNMIKQNQILFVTKENIEHYNIVFPDVYFTYEYGRACEYSDNAIWECCIYKDLIYVYLKREYIIENKNENENTNVNKKKTYYELITPYGYSGYYYKNYATFLEFIPIFRKEVKNKNYIIEILRQNPYIYNVIHNKLVCNYDILKEKYIYSIEIDNYQNYYNSLKRNIKNKFRKAIKLGLLFEYKQLKEGDLNETSIFRKLYTKTMNKVNSTGYYYFNNKYFKELEKLNAILVYIKNKENEIIGSSILILYNEYIHYHLSCNNNSTSCITDFLLLSIVKKFSVNKKFILGGGIVNNDSLSKFKEKLSTHKYKYIIYKNILNNNIYDHINTKL